MFYRRQMMITRSALHPGSGSGWDVMCRHRCQQSCEEAVLPEHEEQVGDGLYEEVPPLRLAKQAGDLAIDMRCQRHVFVQCYRPFSKVDRADKLYMDHHLQKQIQAHMGMRVMHDRCKTLPCKQPRLPASNMPCMAPRLLAKRNSEIIA